MRLSLPLFFILIGLTASAQVTEVNIAVNSSFRALSVVDDRVAWVAGSNGQVGRTVDGGTTWQFNQVRGFEKMDFRSLYAFDQSRAIIANAGSPASILITHNAGTSWEVVYTNAHADAFFDGIDFWNEREGLIYGDPIDNRMLLLRTADGGLSWSAVASPPGLENGEASFAASGTGIRCFNTSNVVIATGGVLSRLWHSTDKGNTWRSLPVPIIQGESSTGIFSVGIHGNTWVVAGGDFNLPQKKERHIFYSTDGGVTWHTPETATRGYRECVEPARNGMWLAAGPTGAETSDDQGKTWKSLSDEQGIHTVRQARNGSLILMAGSRRLWQIKLKAD